MDPEEVIELFDSCWFEMGIFKEIPSSSRFSSFESKQDQEKLSKSEITPFSDIPTIRTRSMSDRLSMETSFLSSGSFSPDSVLFSPKLHPVLSGKEITEENLERSRAIEEITHRKKMASRRRSMKMKKWASKSLSELEFEELKGFMDLGFIFTEEDNNDSRLVEIVPGLQRLGKKNDEVKESGKEEGGAAVSRPYLSEAWEVEDRKREEKPLMDWSVLDLSNEIDMKDNLRCWAHTVASTVR
ncbi:hypothetical protein SLA2020_405630 [Shorea laevis]